MCPTIYPGNNRLRSLSNKENRNPVVQSYEGAPHQCHGRVQPGGKPPKPSPSALARGGAGARGCLGSALEIKLIPA